MPNQKNVLIARTTPDSSAKYVSSWAELIKKEANLLGFYVIDLQDEDFEESKIKKLIETYDPFFIFLSSHGTQYSIKGQDKKTDIIVRCKNNYLFKDRIVYALACHTSIILGKSSKMKGCKCYIGYSDEVKFPFQELDNPFDDFVAEPFMKISNEIPLTLLRGGSPEDAYRNSQIVGDDLIKYWEKQNKVEAPQIVKWIKTFKKRLVMDL